VVHVEPVSVFFKISPRPHFLIENKIESATYSIQLYIPMILQLAKPSTSSMNVPKQAVDTSSSGSDGYSHMLNVQEILALRHASNHASSDANADADDDAIAMADARKMTFKRQWAAAFAEKNNNNNDTIATDCDLSDDSYSDDLSDDEYCTTSDDEEETEVAKAMVKAAFTRTLSAPAFTKFMGNDIDDSTVQVDEHSTKRARLTYSNAAQSSQPELERVGARLPMVDSAPAVLKLNDSRLTHSVSSNTTIPTTTTTATLNVNSTKPDDYLRSLLAQNGMSTKTFSALEIKDDFFLKVTAESVEAYDMQVVKAVRTQDVATLRQLLESGRSLQCGNKFGESIVHTACRKGSLAVLQFLLQEADVSCRVICDYGRTPLHDACWTSEKPNFELMDLLLTACPDLLHVQDARGFLPLAYVRQAHWDDWCRYLKTKNVEQLTARELV
jgi:hypothetical protein